jgi:hypothetical protein
MCVLPSGQWLRSKQRRYARNRQFMAVLENGRSHRIMRVWTVHPLFVWECLQDAGALYVDPAKYDEGYVPWQYRWLAHELQERVSGYVGGLPWWAYCAKPDLRWVRHHRPVGQPQVRIELEINPAFIIPSWAWDVIYSGRFLAFMKREQEAWETAMRQAVADEDIWPLPEPWRGEIEASWRRLFDPELPAHGWADVDSSAHPHKEAVFETLFLREVRSVTHFIGRSRWSL